MIERELRALGLEYDMAQPVTDISGLARTALREGARFLVACGDDRTIHEVVNGMIEGGRAVSDDAVLGVIPTGQCDFVKTFGLTDDPVRSIRNLAGEDVFPFDVGQAVARSEDGTERVRYFVNIAQIGRGASAVAGTAGTGGRLTRPGAFIGFWRSVLQTRLTPVRIEAGQKEFSGAARNIVVANCQYSGGGQRLSPRSWPSDGLLDVLVFSGPKSEAYTLLPLIFRGEHLPHPNIVELKGRAISVEADRTLPVEVDGMFLGYTPASFDVVRLGGRLKI